MGSDRHQCGFSSVNTRSEWIYDSSKIRLDTEDQYRISDSPEPRVHMRLILHGYMRKYRWKYFSADELWECMLDEFSMGVVYFIIRIHVGTALVQHYLRTNPVSTAHPNAACIQYSRVIRINPVSAAVRIWRWMRTFLTVGFYRMLQYGGNEWLPSTMSWITYSLSITAAEISPPLLLL